MGVSGPAPAATRRYDGLRLSLRTMATVQWQLAVIVLLSIALTGLYLYARPYIFYHDSDPLTYFRKAWLLLGRAGGFDVASRGPGYPLWLIVTGAAPFDSWWVLMASQVVMAILLPVLVYATLAPVSRTAGLIGGLLFMIFGLPYIHMTWAMTEQLFLFVELLSLALISRYLCASRAAAAAAGAALRPEPWSAERVRAWLASPYPIALLLAYATMIKPAAGPFFWIFVAVCLLFRVGPKRRYLGPVVLYVAIMTAWTTADYYQGWARFPTIARPFSQAQRVFADAYYGDGHATVETGWATIRASDGPGSRELHRAVTEAVAASRRSGQWNSTDPTTIERLYTRFDTPEQLTAEIFARPNPLYFTTIVHAAAPAGGDRLLDSVAREHGHGGPGGLARYMIRHPMAMLMGPPNPYLGYMLLSKFFRYQHMRADGYIGVRDLLIMRENVNLIQEGNGPAAVNYFNSIRYFIDAMPEFIAWQNYREDFRDAEELKRYLVGNPRITKYTSATMGTIYTWMSMLYGERRTGRLMAATALEIVRTNPLSWGFLVGDFFAVTAYGEGGEVKADLSGFLTGPGAEYARVRDLQEQLLKERIEGSRTTQLPAGLASHMGRYNPDRTDLQRNVNAGLLIQHSAFSWAKPLWFFGTLVFATALVVAGIGSRFVIFLILAYFASAAAMTMVMIPPTGDPRQEEFFSFLPLLILALGLAALPRLVGLIRRQSAPD